MRKSYPVFSMIMALVGLLSTGSLRALEIPIKVSPNVLNIGSQSRVVTVHTGIAYGEVDVTSVYLNGIAIESWKADARGEFVAKFSSDAVKTLDGLRIDEENTLLLQGLTRDKQEFWGEATILVIDVESGGEQARDRRKPGGTRSLSARPGGPDED
jgi:hypothetical protein